MPKKKSDGFDGRIWPNLLDFNVKMDDQLTSKSNFLFGASTAIFFAVLNKGLSADQIFAGASTYAWYILLAGSFFSMMTSLMVILPKLWFFSYKDRIKDDIFYYKNIRRFYSRQGFWRCIKDLPTDQERISKAYANQVYTLATHIIPYKFRLLKISGWTLLISVLSSVLVMVLVR